MKRITHLCAILLSIAFAAGLFSGCSAARTPLETVSYAPNPVQESAAACSEEPASIYQTAEPEEECDDFYYETPCEPAPGYPAGTEEYSYNFV